MLVLTRKHQEKIRIGDNIVITVLKTKGKTVRLGIEAPSEVPVIRGELSFDGHAVQWQPKANEAEGEGPLRAATVEVNHVDRVRAHWPAKTQPTSAARAPGIVTPQVSLQRVSREQVSQVLPSLVSGTAPLRALVNRRSVSA